MRRIHTALLAGGAALAVTGAIAHAQTSTAPVAVLLPGGFVEIVQARPMPVAVPQGFVSPFAVLARMEAEMNQASALMAQQMAAQQALFARLPMNAAPGVVSVGAMPGSCFQSVQITFAPGDAQPHVVRQQEGDCGTSTPTPAVQPGVAVPKPGLIEVQNKVPKDGGLKAPVGPPLTQDVAWKN